MLPGNKFTSFSETKFAGHAPISVTVQKIPWSFSKDFSTVGFLFFATITFAVAATVDQPLPTSEFTAGFPCELIPNFCDRVRCLPPEECSDGIVVKGGGNCGCCDVCVRFTAKLGESCTPTVPDPAVVPANTYSQYYDYTDVCEQPLECKSGKCADATTKECQEMQNDAKVAVYTMPPECDFYGDFALKRCKGLEGDNPRCFCVDKNGDTIFGRLPTGSDNVTCACSRAYSDQKTADTEAGRFIRCEETGDFTELQCINNVCFCINTTSAMITTSAVPISAITALPCYSSDVYGDSFYTSCQKELYKMQAILKEFQIKGVTVNDIDTCNCDPDGTYAPVQYAGDKWFCADREGVEMESYETQDTASYMEMLCNCARDSTYSDGLPDNARGRQCVPNGDYNTDTPKCVDNMCYCLDSDGQRDSCDVTMAAGLTCPVTCP